MSSLPRIESIDLHQVGVFDDMHIEFPPIASPEADARKAELHVFTGPNGCGKSTVLYALAGIFLNKPDFSSHLRSRLGSQSRIDFCFLGEHDVYGPATDTGYHIGIRAFDDYFRAVSTVASDVGRIYHDKTWFSAFSYSGQRTLIDQSIDTIGPITESPFDDSLSFDASIRPKLLLRWIANNRTQSALAKADGDLEAAQTYDQALKRITDLIKNICDLDVEFKLNRSPLAVTVRVNGDLIHFDGLPDGLKSIISWVADLSLRLEAVPWESPGDVFEQPIFLFLDEVDIHLHPKWQRRILPAIQKLLPNAQVFVSTHSPFVVGSVEDAWVYRLPEPGSGIHEVKAIPSGAGKSYRLILEEVFDIDTEFDIETEARFAELYQARQEFLKNPANDQPLLDAARWLHQRSPEAALIVSRELRQMARLTGRELSLA